MFKFSSGVKLTALVSVTLFWLLTAGGCGSSQVADKRSGHDENLTRLNRAARIAYDNGQLEQAANLYRQTLDRAYLRDDREAIVGTKRIKRQDVQAVHCVRQIAVAK